MAYIEVNDIFDELKDENQRLKQLVNVLIEFKDFCDLIVNKLKPNLESNDFRRYLRLSLKTEDIFNGSNNGLQSVNDISMQTNGQLMTATVVQPSVGQRVDEDIEVIEIDGTDDSKTYQTFTHPSQDIPSPNRPNDRQFRCGYSGCGKGFTTNYHLNRHKATHITERHFKCPAKNCFKRFKLRDHLASHLKQKHPDRSCAELVNRLQSQYFHCQLCGRKFQYEGSLRTHNCAEQSHICEICGQGFRKLSRLLDHKSQIHHIVNSGQSSAVTFTPNQSSSSFEFQSTSLIRSALQRRLGPQTVITPTFKTPKTPLLRTPKRKNPPTPYSLFVKDISKQLIGDNFHMKTFSQNCSQIWKSLPESEKVKYSQKAAHLRRVMGPTQRKVKNPQQPEKIARRTQNNLNKAKKVIDPNKPKRQLSCYWVFAQQNRKLVHSQMKEQMTIEGKAMPNSKDINIELGNRWRMLSEEEKNNYRVGHLKHNIRVNGEEDDDEVVIISSELGLNGDME